MPINFAQISSKLKEREGGRLVPQVIVQMRIEFAAKIRQKKLKAVKEVIIK